MIEISEQINENNIQKTGFSLKINRVLILCINFVICANFLVYFRNEIHPFIEPELITLINVPPFNFSSRPLQNLLLRLLSWITSKPSEAFFIITIIFSPIMIYIFFRILELYEFKASTQKILLFLFSTIGPFQNYILGFNSDFLFLTLFLAGLYYLKTENTTLFIIFSILAVLNKEVAVLLVILNFFYYLDTENYLFNKTNFNNILIALPIVAFLGITRIFLNPVTYINVAGLQFTTLGIPELSIPSFIFFLGVIWLVPIFVWNKISKFDKIFIIILFGIYLPLIMLLGNIWELKLLIPYTFAIIPSVGYWLERNKN